MGSAASSQSPNKVAASLDDSPMYNELQRKALSEKESGTSNLEIFNNLSPNTEDRHGIRARGSCPDITPHSTIASTIVGFPQIKKFQSDLGIPLSEEKRRRAQLFEGTSISNLDFMGGGLKKKAKGAENASKEKIEAGSIVMTAFRKFFFIGEDTFDRMPLVISALQLEHREQGEYMIRLGEEGDKMYVIMSGVYEVMMPDEETIKLELSHGDLVGEVALVYNEKRMASVRVKESGDLFSLSRIKFRELQALASTSSIVKRCTWLHSVKCLSQINYFGVSLMAQNSRTKEYEKGDVIIKEGDVCASCIMLEAGSVLVKSSQNIKLEQAFTKPEEKLSEEKEEEGVTSAPTTTSDVAVEGGLVVGPGSFFGEGVLKGAAGLETVWEVAAGGGVISPITVIAQGSERIITSSFLTEDLVDTLSEKIENLVLSDDAVAEQLLLKHKEKAQKKYDIEDFEMLEFLGQGSFGSVKLVKSKEPEDSSKYPPSYALKAMSKAFIMSSDQLDHTLDEREIVMQLKHPNVLNVYATFQSKDELYLLSEYIAGCDLWALIHNDAAKTGLMYGLPVGHVLFYSANVVEALGHIHKRGIAYRDLKPENVMVDASGYLKVIDFGFAKKIPYTVEVEGNTQLMPKSHTMCGTPEYLAPEFITSEGHDHTVDLWALGVMIHELVTSKSPFSDGSDNMTQLFTNIVTTLYTGVRLDHNFTVKAGGNNNISDLVKGFCSFKSTERLGGSLSGMDEVKKMPAFADINFQDLFDRKIEAPWIPDQSGLGEFREEEEDRTPELFEGDQNVFATF